MSNHGHHHRKSRKRNPINDFLDRLRGRRRYKPPHRSAFPGINLPKDYDPETWKEKSGEEKRPLFMDELEEGGKDFSGKEPLTQPAFDKEPARSGRSRRKRTLSESIELFFRKRELRREERMREKLKRRHRRKSQEEFKKINQGPALGKQLFKTTEEGEEPEKEKQLPLFSQRNPIFRNLTIVVNSAMIFMLTYVLVYLFYWLSSMLVASVYGLDSTLYYYDLKFNDHSPLWDRFNILLVTGIPPFFCLALGLFLYRVLFDHKRFAGLQKLFILWSAFHLFNHFFGAFPAGIVTDEGFGYVAAWLYMNTAFKFLFSLISIFVLGLIGYYSAKRILETTDSMHRIKGGGRLSFILYQMALPMLIGTIILFLLRIPHNFDYPYETLMLFSMMFLVFPAFFNEKVKPELNLMKIKKKRSIHVGYLVMMLFLLAFLRIMLGIGLHFLIEINISISPAIS